MFYLCAWLRGSPDAACPHPWAKRFSTRKTGRSETAAVATAGTMLTDGYLQAYG